MKEDLEDLIFKLGINPQYAKKIFNSGQFEEFLKGLRKTYAKGGLHSDVSKVSDDYMKEINSAIDTLLNASKSDLEAAINSVCEKDPRTIEELLKQAVSAGEKYKEESELYKKEKEELEKDKERLKEEKKTLEKELGSLKYKKTTTQPPPPSYSQSPPSTTSSISTVVTSQPSNLGKKILIGGGILIGGVALLSIWSSISDYFGGNRPSQKTTKPPISRTYTSKGPGVSTTQTTPTKIQKTTPSPQYRPVTPPINFTFVESLPLEDKILYDIFVKGNSSNFTSSSLDSSLMQCVRAGLSPFRNENFKAVFDINDNGDVVYCDFVAQNVRDSKPEILSQKDSSILSGLIEEKRRMTREGNYNLVLIVKGKQVTVPIPFSMQREYEWYDNSFVDFDILKSHYEYENKGEEGKVKSFFKKYYQGDVAIDNEHAYIIHNDLNGPTLVKVSLKPYLDGEYYQGMDVSEHIWRKKELDKNFKTGNDKPSGRRLRMDVDNSNIYISFKIHLDFEQETRYMDTMHPFLYIAIIDKNNFELKKKIGGQIGRGEGPGVRYVTDLKADGRDRFYVVNHWNGGQVMVRDSNGNLIKYLGREGVLPGKFRDPSMVGFDASGNVYVLDYRNKRIQKFRVD